MLSADRLAVLLGTGGLGAEAVARWLMHLSTSYSTSFPNITRSFCGGISHSAVLAGLQPENHTVEQQNNLA